MNDNKKRFLMNDNKKRFLMKVDLCSNQNGAVFQIVKGHFCKVVVALFHTNAKQLNQQFGPAISKKVRIIEPFWRKIKKETEIGNWRNAT